MISTIYYTDDRISTIISETKTKMISFTKACGTGNPKVLKQIWNMSKHFVDIHVGNEFEFRWACYRGHKAIVDLLWAFSDMSI